MLTPPFSITGGHEFAVGKASQNSVFGFSHNWWLIDPSKRKIKGLCYDFQMVYDECHAHSFEAYQCRPAFEDLMECQNYGKHNDWLKRKAQWRAQTDWERSTLLQPLVFTFQQRRYFEYVDAVKDRNIFDPRPLVEKVEDAKRRFDFSSGTWDIEQLASTYFGESGTFKNPTHWSNDKISLNYPKPGFLLDITWGYSPFPSSKKDRVKENLPFGLSTSRKHTEAINVLPDISKNYVDNQPPVAVA